MYQDAGRMHAIIAREERMFRSREKREVDAGRGHGLRS